MNFKEFTKKELMKEFEEAYNQVLESGVFFTGEVSNKWQKPEEVKEYFKPIQDIFDGMKEELGFDYKMVVPFNLRQGDPTSGKDFILISKKFGPMKAKNIDLDKIKQFFRDKGFKDSKPVTGRRGFIKGPIAIHYYRFMGQPIEFGVLINTNEVGMNNTGSSKRVSVGRWGSM